MGFWIAGLDVNTTNDKRNSKYRQIGYYCGIRRKRNEDSQQNCDFLVKIPISKDVESLNASNAASIIFTITNLIYDQKRH